MHEYSIMSQIVQTVIIEVEARNAIKVKAVNLEVGELTFLGKDQMEFAWEALTEEGILKGTELRIEGKDSLVECSSCGFKGPLPVQEEESMKHFIPRFCCPKCQGKLTILEGKECIIKNITMVVDDVPIEG